MERYEREALDAYLTRSDEDPADFEDPRPMFEDEWADGWEPYDDRPELAESRARAAAGGRGFVDPVVTGKAPTIRELMAIAPGRSSRDQHWYDLDAATAGALMVLGILAVPAGAVGFWLARRFRVVRR